MIVVLILWAVLNIVLLYALVNLMSRQKNKAMPVSHTDRLTHNEQYSEKLMEYGEKLSDLSREITRCQKDYDAQSEAEEKARLAQELAVLRRRHELTRIKCSRLLNKLD